MQAQPDAPSQTQAPPFADAPSIVVTQDDIQLALVRFGLRDYDPQSGRFFTRDQAFWAGGANLYEYGRNDPIAFVDVTGFWSIEASFYNRMESVGGFSGKGNQLNAYYFATGNPDYFNEDLSRYLALTASDIQTAAAFWLPAGRRAELSVIPAKPTGPSR